MKIDIISIGNSRGIRIPNALLRQYGFDGQVELSPRPDGLLLAPSSRPRADWRGRFKTAPEALLPDISLNRWEADEWEW